MGKIRTPFKDLLQLKLSESEFTTGTFDLYWNDGMIEIEYSDDERAYSVKIIFDGDKIENVKVAETVS